ncbi:MAG: hypothetical protein ABFC63_06615 [Thermoguttaceae bacterium]
MTDVLQEFCDSRGVKMRVDREAGVIRGVKVLGLESRNGRSYLPEALAKAAPLYEEAKVNVNHPRGNPGGPRDYQDRIGTVRSVTLRPGEGLFADFHFNPKHALAEQLIWDAERSPENVGFSHNVEARCVRRGDRLVVEAITRVQSVDLVADPATTRGLFEDAAPEDGQAATVSSTAEVGETSTEDNWQQGPFPAEDGTTREPTSSQSAAATETPDGDSPLQGDAVAIELAQLRHEVERLRAQEAMQRKQVAAFQLLREHGLPDADAADPWSRAVSSRQFLETLLAASDESAMRALVEDRARLVRTLSESRPAVRQAERRPCSRDQHVVYAPEPLGAKRFIEAIT